MNRFLSPADICEVYRIKRTTAFNLLKEYEQTGHEVIKIGKLRRVEQESFTEFLKERNK